MEKSSKQFSLDQQCYKHSVVFGGCKVLFVQFAIVRKDKKIPIWIVIQMCDVHVAFCSLLNVWEPCIYSIDSLKLYWFIYNSVVTTMLKIKTYNYTNYTNLILTVR